MAFPYADDAPSIMLEEVGYLGVALLVCFQFSLPEAGVTRRKLAVLGAAMPKTSIHKDGEAGPTEYEVWFAKD